MPRHSEAYDPDNPKQLSNWFDPYNVDHVRAYSELKCSWPQWFLDLMEVEGIVIDEFWSSFVQTKLIKAWVTQSLKTQGLPSRVKVMAEYVCTATSLEDETKCSGYMDLRGECKYGGHICGFCYHPKTE